MCCSKLQYFFGYCNVWFQFFSFEFCYFKEEHRACFLPCRLLSKTSSGITTDHTAKIHQCTNRFLLFISSRHIVILYIVRVNHAMSTNCGETEPCFSNILQECSSKKNPHWGFNTLWFRLNIGKVSILRTVKILISHLISIKDICLVIWAEFLIWGTPWAGPANSHIPRCHYFKFKVPLPPGHSVWFIWSEHSAILSRDETWVW